MSILSIDEFITFKMDPCIDETHFMAIHLFYLSCVMRKSIFGFRPGPTHKHGCTAIEDGSRPTISDLESRGIDYLCSENKGAD